jgi:hypothetical protein
MQRHCLGISIFLPAAQDDTTRGGGALIFPVLILSIPHDQHPGDIKGASGELYRLSDSLKNKDQSC